MTFVLIGIIVAVPVFSVLDAGLTKLAQWEINKFHSKSVKHRTGFFAALES
jgi:hypothetical protein